MRAEDARRQALKGLADAKKSNEKSSNRDKAAIRDKIETAEGILSSPDFCRAQIKAYGKSFREFQAQADASCAAMLSRVTDAVAGAVGAGDYDNILSRLYDWMDAKSSFETVQRYIENNEGGNTIMTSEIKNNLTALLSQTADDICNFDKLHSDYYGTDAGSEKDIMDRLLQIKDLIADTEIPNTQATYDMYKQIRTELDKIRNSVAKGYTYDIDTSVNRIAEKADKLVEMAKSGGLRDKTVKNPDLGKPYPNTGTIDINEINADDLDELDSGVVIYKTFNQADSIINRMYDNALNIIFGIKGLNEDPQLKDLQARGQKLNKQLKEARTDAQKDIIRTQLRSVTARMKERQAYIGDRVKKLTDYYAVQGQAYNEIAQYMEKLMSYFIPLPGQYKLTLKKYQEYIKKVQDYINSRGKLFSFSSKNKIKSIADIVELYQKALSENDVETVQYIKSAVDLSVENMQGVSGGAGVKESKKYQLLDSDYNKVKVTEPHVKTEEEKEAQRKEDEEFDLLFGEEPVGGDETGGEGTDTDTDTTTEEPITEDPGTDEIPDDIKEILREVENLK